MDLLELPDNPIPAGAVVHRVETDDGVTLRAAHFLATSRPLKGTVCIFQGRGEQIEKYFHVVETLRSRGFAVALFDWRGQGGSARLTRGKWKGHVASFSDYGRDIEAFRRQVALPDCPPPYFGLCHSMGGLITLAHAPDLKPWLNRLVLTAPFLGFGPRSMKRGRIEWLVRLMSMLGLGKMAVPSIGRKALNMPGFEGNPLTSDPDRFRLMHEIIAARPDLAIGAPTFAWVKAMMDGMDIVDAEDFPARIPMPFLIVNSGGEELVSRDAIDVFSRRWPRAGYVLIPGARHEVMNERRIFAAQFWAAFDAYIPGSPAK